MLGRIRVPSPGDSLTLEQKNGKPRQRGCMSPMLPVTPVKQWKYENNSLEECRNLVRILAKRTETLYHECRSDKEKTTHIHAIRSTLGVLTTLVKKLDTDSRPPSMEILEDARGFTYQSVRSCDLERISDK